MQIVGGHSVAVRVTPPIVMANRRLEHRFAMTYDLDFAAGVDCGVLSLSVWSKLSRYWASFSFVGLVSATLLFAASLTPSLLPRIYVVQGLLSGIALALGYGIGVFAEWLWRYLEIPEPRGRVETVFKWLTILGVVVVAGLFLWRATVWQNSIRKLMEMEPLESAYPTRVILIAIAFGALLVAASRILWWCYLFVDRRVSRFVPQRVSNVLSTLILGYLLIVIINGVLARSDYQRPKSRFARLAPEVSRRKHGPLYRTGQLARPGQPTLGKNEVCLCPVRK